MQVFWTICLWAYVGQCFGQGQTSHFETLLQAFPEQKPTLELSFNTPEEATTYLQKAATTPLSEKYYPLLQFTPYGADEGQVYPIAKFKRNPKIVLLLHVTRTLSNDEKPEWRFYLTGFSRKGDYIGQELVAAAVHNEEQFLLKQFKINPQYQYTTTEKNIAYHNNFGIPTELAYTRTAECVVNDTGAQIVQNTQFTGIQEFLVNFDAEEFPHADQWRDCQFSGKKWMDALGQCYFMISKCGIHGVKVGQSRWHSYNYQPQTKQFNILKSAAIGDSICSVGMLGSVIETQILDLDNNQQAEIFWYNELNCSNKDRKNYVLIEINLLHQNTLYQLKGEVFPREKKAQLINEADCKQIPKLFLNYMQAAWQYSLFTHDIR